ncbi:MAG TPA: hypothetical protein VGO67_25865 [Verrucomicrobiae bacterium]|jgi:hypothetical protein
MNLQEELATLICAHHPVLTIISNKGISSPEMAMKTANKRRKKSSARR